jgi:hypothetical protein
MPIARDRFAAERLGAISLHLVAPYSLPAMIFRRVPIQ